MATTADIRKGLCIEFKDGLFQIIEFQHVKPGKGGAFVRTKLRNLRTGAVLDNTFDSGEKINIARVERRQYQYLYAESEDFHFMHAETYEQITIPKEMIESSDLMKEGLVVDIVFHADSESPLSAEMPAYVTLEVTYTEPGEKGNTATNAMKDAKVETGATVKVPLFINTGDLIKVDTRTYQYSERVKK